MSDITTIGLDLAKTVFHMVCFNASGRVVKKFKCKRGEVLSKLAQQPQCKIAMEACSGAHYWGRELKALGHDVKLINPSYVKAYLKTNKNDWNDAEAIAEASTRPTMRFVSIKNLEQQDIQSIHRVRSQYMKQRISTSNHIRGLLSEYGEVIGLGTAKLLEALPVLLEDKEGKLSGDFKELLHDLHEHFIELDKKVKALDVKIERLTRSNEKGNRLLNIPGIGPKTASIMLSTLTDPALFKNGREFSAFLGLVPKQSSSGGKDRLLGISKRGDRYIRSLLIHGARAILKVWRRSPPKTMIHQWAVNLLQRKSFNQVAVAVANKNARIIWALLAYGGIYDANNVEVLAHEGVLSPSNLPTGPTGLSV